MKKKIGLFGFLPKSRKTGFQLISDSRVEVRLEKKERRSPQSQFFGFFGSCWNPARTLKNRLVHTKMCFCGVGRRLEQRSSSEERCPSARKTSAIRSVVALNIGASCYHQYCSPGTIFCFLFSLLFYFFLDGYDVSISLHKIHFCPG